MERMYVKFRYIGVTRRGEVYGLYEGPFGLNFLIWLDNEVGDGEWVKKRIEDCTPCPRPTSFD
jgi:hypothetical protein